MRTLSGRTAHAAALLLTLLSTAPASARDASLIAAYDFREGSGTLLRDTSGHGNHARIRGAAWVRVGARTPLRFDGLDDYVDCGPAPSVPAAGPITVEMWFQPEDLPYGEAALAGRGLGSYMLTYSGGAYPARAYWHVPPVSGASRARAPVGIWHHIVATFDGKVLRQYVDGTTAGGVRRWREQYPASTGPLRIGGGLDGLAHFRGLIGEVRIYRRALARDEVLRRYLAGKRGRKPLPVSRPRSEPMPAGRCLNNLVIELLRDHLPAGGTRAYYRFRNPRDGWVFASASGVRGADTQVSLGGGFVVSDGETPAEVMCHLPAGEHTLSVVGYPARAARTIVVRAIPELIYATYPASPVVPEYGAYSWHFLGRDVLPNVNVIVGAPEEGVRDTVAAWRALGRRFISEHTAPWADPNTGRTPRSAEDIVRALRDKPGLRAPGVDGMVLDTHDVGHSRLYAPYSDALLRLATDKPFRDRRLWFYCDCLYGSSESLRFAQAVISSGYTLAWTRYLHEQPTLAAAREFLEAGLAEEARGWRRNVPGSMENMVMVLGYLTSPGERMNVEPGVDYRVFMDMQCRLLATNPAFRGLRGVMWYKSGYADEDAVRWAGRLFRHYFIEGRTTPLSRDPYVLPHIRNPDFENDTEGWTVAEAEPGSVAPGYLDRYGFQQGRWLETGVGDRFLRMRRSTVQPNVVSQTIRGLRPGRLYSVELYSADYRALREGTSSPTPHALTIAIESGDALPARCFDRPYPNWSYYHLGPYDDQESQTKAWITFHRRAFRATAPTARLVISDWAAPNNPGGPAGQELIINFVEVQPHVE